MSVEKKPRVRVSKNRKRNWNKYCDVTEVEDYLEEKRFDERIGGAVSEKSNADLFFIQTDAEQEKKSSNKQKTLKCFQNIGSYSKVPPPCNRSIKAYSKKIKNALTRADDRRTKKFKNSSPREDKDEGKILQLGDMFCAELKDLWGEEEKIDPEIEHLVKFRDEYTRKRTPNIPGHRYQKPSLLPPVEIPHSGASYNPSFEEHQELLEKALLVEEKKLKEELHLKRVLTDMFPTRAEAPTKESVLKEMSQGLFDEEDEEEEETESTFYLRNPPVSSEDRIPKARKRRKKERKEQERLKSLEKQQKKELNEVYRIRSIKSEIKQQNDLTQSRMETRQQKRIDKMYQPKTLGKYKYEAPELEIKLSDELSSSLRTLQSEGNLLEDRYKSLQRRNLIEPRVRQKVKRKYKLKVQVKRSHRDFK